MPEHLDGSPEGIEKPSLARVYDYLLGGHHNHPADREFAERYLAENPDAANVARANRAFVARAVRHALSAGITQFIDIGSGLPSSGQPHEIADAEAPEMEARVVYVDNEPSAHARPHTLLSPTTDPARHRAVVADFHDFKDLWDKVVRTGVFRVNEPTCLIVTALLHHFGPETEPNATMAFYREQLAPGSHLVLTHATEARPEFRHAIGMLNQLTAPVRLRTVEEFKAFFGDWVLVKPGVCWTVQWRPDDTEERWWGDDPARAGLLAGVAIKPLALG